MHLTHMDIYHNDDDICSQLRTSILVSISILALANHSPGIIFFNVFMEQLHGRTVIVVYGDDKQLC